MGAIIKISGKITAETVNSWSFFPFAGEMSKTFGLELYSGTFGRISCVLFYGVLKGRQRNRRKEGLTQAPKYKSTVLKKKLFFTD